MPIISAKEYAAHRGISLVAVSKAIKTGRLANAIKGRAKGGYQIDRDEADREWPTGERELLRDALAGRIESKSIQVQGLDLDENPTTAGAAAAYVKARAVREAMNAKIAKLDLEEKAGRLIDAEQVKNEAFKAARAVRDSLLNIPDRLAPELAAETNQFKVHARLLEEMRRALEGLASAFRE